MAFSRWTNSRSNKNLLGVSRQIPRVAPKLLRKQVEVLEDRASPTSFTWIGETGGAQNWSDPTQWSGGVAPTSNVKTTLTFLNNVPTGYTANNDIASPPFTLNTLTFNGRYGYMNDVLNTFVDGITLGGSNLNFVTSGGTNPSIVQSGSGSVDVGMSGLGINDPLTVSGNGNGNLFLDGITLLSGVNPNIIINRGGNGLTDLDFPNGSPTVTLDAGNFGFGFSGSANLIVNGGNLSYGIGQNAGTNTSTNDPITLNKTLNITGYQSVNEDGFIYGSGGISVYPLLPMTVSLENTDDFSGTVTAGSSYFSPTGATVQISSNGSTFGYLSNAFSLTAAKGGTIALNYEGLPVNEENPSLVSASVPVTLESGGTFAFLPYVPNPITTQTTSQTLGILNASGNPTVSVRGGLETNSTGGVVYDYGVDGDVTFSTYAPVAGTATLFQGQNLGETNDPANTFSDYVNFSNSTSLTNQLVGGNGAGGIEDQSILPTAYGNMWTSNPFGAGNTLVTYSASTGIQPLESYNYANSISPGTTTSANILETSPYSINSSALSTVNALVLDGGSSGYGQLTGNGRLGITSGVILAAGSNPSSSVSSPNRNLISSSQLSLGTAAGEIIVPTALTISSDITGFEGYTLSGGGSLALTGTNTALSGPVYLTSGNLIVNSIASNLGGSGAINFNGGTLDYTGVGESVGRAIALGVSGGTFVNNGTGNITLTGGLSGTGNLNTDGGTLVLNASSLNSAFLGNFDVQAGTLQVDNAASLGNAASVTLQAGDSALGSTAGTLYLPNAMTISRPITLQGYGSSSGQPDPVGAATIDNDNTVTVSAPIGYRGDVSSAYGLNKTGTGKLILNGEDTFNGVLDVQQGTVQENGQLDAINEAGNGVDVESGATLSGTGNIIRDIQVNGGGTLHAGTTVGTLTTGGVTFAGTTSDFTPTINSAVAGTGYSQLIANGQVTLNNATLKLSLGYTPAVGDVITIIKNDSGLPIAGNFNGDPEGTQIVTPQGTFQISYQGNGGNDVTLTALDTTPPTLLSINLSVPSTSVTNASQVTFSVNFSKPVIGLSAGNFQIVGTAASSASFGTISTSDGGQDWSIPILGLSSVNGTIGLNLVSAAGITDLYGNNLSTSSYVGPVYTIDHMTPSTTISLAAGQAASTNLTPINFAVAFSEPVTGFTASNVKVSGTGEPGKVTVTGSGENYTISVGYMGNSGTVSVSIAAGAVTDLAGNGNGASNSATVTYVAASLFALAAGSGNGPDIRVYDAASDQLRYNFFAYAPGFRGGVSVATGDFNGDGIPDIVTGSGPGARATIEVFNGTNGTVLPGYSFYAFPATYLGGVNVAVGDVTGSGYDDIIVSTKAGVDPHVEIFDGKTLALISSFDAYAPTFLGGVTLATADVEGIGKDDLIVGTASGNSPHVEVFNISSTGQATRVRSFMATGIQGSNGISVSGGISAAGNPDAEIVVGDLTNGTVATYNGTTGAKLLSFSGFEAGVTNVGARVASVDTTGDGITDQIVVASGQSTTPRIRIFNSVTGAFIAAYDVYDPDFLGGIFVG